MYEWAWMIIAVIAIPLVALMIWDNHPTMSGVENAAAGLWRDLMPPMPVVASEYFPEKARYWESLSWIVRLTVGFRTATAADPHCSSSRVLICR